MVFNYRMNSYRRNSFRNRKQLMITFDVIDGFVDLRYSELIKIDVSQSDHLEP